MGKDSGSSAPARRMLEAVCFDFRGVILDHKTNENVLPGMEGLLRTLKVKGLRLSVISRFPAEIVIGRLGPMQRFFGAHIYSGGGLGKLDRIREFANKCGIDDLARIAFVDDKPDNIVPVAQESDVYVIGFRGSGKYPKASHICRDQGIAFAEDIEGLRKLLLEQRNP